MRLLKGLLGKKSQNRAVDDMPVVIPESVVSQGADGIELDREVGQAGQGFNQSKTKAVFDAHRQADGAGSSTVNIWDVEGDKSKEAATPAPATGAQASSEASVRSRRNRTRIIGFEKSSGEIVDLFNDQSAKTVKNQVQFPVGWMLVIDGPGFGHCFSLFAGMAQIGRGEDQSIQLDFGDTAISRNNHAAIVFDPEEKKFVLGHGGKANIVRLNGKPVISNVDIFDGDTIKIGETTLKLKTLVGADFEWNTDAKTDEEDDDDVAIA